MFVKDDGIYIMSNGWEADGDGSATSTVTYAVGFEPAVEGPGWDAQYDKIRDAVGGDDFAEFISAESLGLIPEDAEYLVVRISATRVGWVWQSARKGAS